MNMKINFDKYPDGLVPAIIQDSDTHKVLMLGYMNQDALEKTLADKRVTFFSRSKNRLWTKGETSGFFLDLMDIRMDCDADALLIKVIPKGPVCHTGQDTCFDETNKAGFLSRLENVISERFAHPKDGSYINSLITRGINKIAQKVGEEAVEMIIESKDENRELFLEEAADLLFHYLVLLKAKECTLSEVEEVLSKRMK